MIAVPRQDLDVELDSALRAAEAGFHVRLISTFDPELIAAPPDAIAADWLDHNYPEFDQFPVRENGRTTGVLMRTNHHSRGGCVRDVMQPLCDGSVVSGHMPIADLISQFRSSHFRLVLRDHAIDGLVTHSDLLKLPVRMLVFGLISHFELLLRNVIRKRFDGGEWLNMLSPNRRRWITAKVSELKNERLEPDPLELTLFSDAVKILRNDRALGEDLARDARWVVDCRNDTAHARTFIASPEDVLQFADRIGKLRLWISRVSVLLKEM